MKDYCDIIGKQFGRLKVMKFIGHREAMGRPMPYYECACECGGMTIRARQTIIIKRGVVSCGCARNEFRASGRARRRHGHAKAQAATKTYRAWQSMHARCSNPHNIGFSSYGGRGIRVCAKWAKFDAFLHDVGESPPGHTLERKDVNGNYCPENCIWIPRLEQWNNRQNTVRVVWEGREHLAKDFAAKIGISSRLLRAKLQAGMPVSEIVAKYGGRNER